MDGDSQSWNTQNKSVIAHDKSNMKLHCSICCHIFSQRESTSLWECDTDIPIALRHPFLQLVWKLPKTNQSKSWKVNLNGFQEKLLTYTTTKIQRIVCVGMQRRWNHVWPSQIENTLNEPQGPTVVERIPEVKYR